MLHRNCLQNHVIAGKIKGMIEVTGRLGGRLTQIPNVLREGADTGN
jgi:hypothetical protein